MTEKSPVNWDQIDFKPAFRSPFLGRKAVHHQRHDLLPWPTLLPVLVGWFPDLMKTPVWGKVNVAYVFALAVRDGLGGGVYLRPQRPPRGTRRRT